MVPMQMLTALPCLKSSPKLLNKSPLHIRTPQYPWTLSRICDHHHVQSHWNNKLNPPEHFILRNFLKFFHKVLASNKFWFHLNYLLIIILYFTYVCKFSQNSFQVFKKFYFASLLESRELSTTIQPLLFELVYTTYPLWKSTFLCAKWSIKTPPTIKYYFSSLKFRLKKTFVQHAGKILILISLCLH